MYCGSNVVHVANMQTCKHAKQNETTLTRNKQGLRRLERATDSTRSYVWCTTLKENEPNRIDEDSIVGGPWQHISYH